MFNHGQFVPDLQHIVNSLFDWLNLKEYLKTPFNINFQKPECS